MKYQMLAVLSFAAFAAFSMPSVPQSSIQLVQDESSRRVDITFTLENEPAVITVDIQTNAGASAWASIGGQGQVTMFGDVNKLVAEPGEGKRITWFPRQDWPYLAPDKIRAEIKAWSVNDPPDWMVVSLVVTNMVRYYTSLDYAPEREPTNVTYFIDKLLMRKVKAAYVTWRAGSPLYDVSVGAYAARAFPYKVMLTNDYYLGVHPVTRGQDRIASLGGNGYGWNSTSDPIDNDYTYGRMFVGMLATYNNLRGTSDDSWKGWPQCGHELKSSSAWLNNFRAITGLEIDLPTAAEWEYACRAGTTTAVYNGTDLLSIAGATENLADIAWCQYTRDTAPYVVSGRTQVSLLKPNAWGFYDMLGNFMEWCLNWYQNNTSSDLQVDPRGPESSAIGKRVIRGGWLNNSYQFCTAGVWYEGAPTENHTFRLRAPCIAK